MQTYPQSRCRLSSVQMQTTHPGLPIQKWAGTIGALGLQLIQATQSMRGRHRTSDSQGPMTPTVQNVVSFAQLIVEEEIDLKELAQKVEGARLNKKRFPAVIMRKTNPKSTVLCFKSGRMIIIGSSSELEAEEASQKANRAIEKALNVTMGVKSFRITNIVANADVGFKLQIAKLCEQRYVVRNQNFPGVVYKSLPNIKSVLIFASGKVVFTGAKNKDDIDRGYTELVIRMNHFSANPLPLE